MLCFFFQGLGNSQREYEKHVLLYSIRNQLRFRNNLGEIGYFKVTFFIRLLKHFIAECESVTFGPMQIGQTACDKRGKTMFCRWLPQIFFTSFLDDECLILYFVNPWPLLVALESVCS